jgi:hypothetical protein
MFGVDRPLPHSQVQNRTVSIVRPPVATSYISIETTISPPKKQLVGLQENWFEVLKCLKEDVYTARERQAKTRREVECLHMKRHEDLRNARRFSFEAERSKRERVKFRIDIAAFVISVLALLLSTVALLKSFHGLSLPPPQPEPLQPHIRQEDLTLDSPSDTTQFQNVPSKQSRALHPSASESPSGA